MWAATARSAGSDHMRLVCLATTTASVTKIPLPNAGARSRRTLTTLDDARRPFWAELRSARPSTP